jgi:IS5 family transposase
MCYEKCRTEREAHPLPQQTFAEGTFEPYRKPTRRERVLDEMNRVVPWGELVATIEPVSPKADGPGRPPVGGERMRRLHCLQQWFNLSDPAVEEAVYASRALRKFVGIDLGREPVPAETTICKFRHLLEAHQLGEQLVTRIGEYLAKQGLQVSRGTIVDATIISAPSSTKNRPKEQDPEMHQTKQGKQWYFGMKAHRGVDSRTKRIHSVAATAATGHDRQMLPDLLHGKETRVWGDSAYSGQRDVIQPHAPNAKSFIQTNAHRPRPLTEEDRARNRTKAKVRAKVEHAFLVIKRIFGWANVRYRGLAKNTHWRYISCGLANLYVARRRLVAEV